MIGVVPGTLLRPHPVGDVAEAPDPAHDVRADLLGQGNAFEVAAVLQVDDVDAATAFLLVNLGGSFDERFGIVDQGEREVGDDLFLAAPEQVPRDTPHLVEAVIRRHVFTLEIDDENAFGRRVERRSPQRQRAARFQSLDVRRKRFGAARRVAHDDQESDVGRPRHASLECGRAGFAEQRVLDREGAPPARRGFQGFVEQRTDLERTTRDTPADQAAARQRQVARLPADAIEDHTVLVHQEEDVGKGLQLLPAGFLEFDRGFHLLRAPRPKRRRAGRHRFPSALSNLVSAFAGCNRRPRGAYSGGF